MSEESCRSEATTCSEGCERRHLGPIGRALAVTALLAATAAAVVLAALVSVPSHRLTTLADNEGWAVETLKTYLTAQNLFHRRDYYGKGLLVYANPKDGTGFADLYQVGHGVAPRGEPLRLISRAMAEARPGGKPWHGYYFADIVADPDGPYAFAIECGLCAVPAEYGRSGRNIYVMDIGGIIGERDAAEMYPGLREGDAVPPVTSWPRAEDEAWWPDRWPNE